MCPPARAASSRASAVGQRDQPAREAGQQVDARQSCPLGVRLQQLGGLGSLDPASAERGAELHQPQVADEADLVAPEPLQRDDTDRPRPEAALALQPRRGGVDRHVAQPLGIERLQQPHERRAAPRVQAERAQLRRRVHAQRLACRRLAQVVRAPRGRRADDRALELARVLRRDQLSAERAQQRARDSGRPHHAQPAQLADRLPQQLVVGETPQELRVIVVQREHEAQSRDDALIRRAHFDRAFGTLPRAHELAVHRRRQNPVAKRARRV